MYMPESAPLLAGESEPTTATKFSDVLREPLTPLTQLLLILTLFFLILSSVFIGLFAGAETRLKNVPDGTPTTVTSTIRVPTTVVATATATPVPTSPPQKVSTACSLT